MGRRGDGWIPEDGGWEDLVEDGHGLGAHMLGTAHPYDLHGHKPADRWGSRHEVTSERFTDRVSRLEESRSATTSGRGVVRPPGPGATGGPTTSKASTPRSGPPSPASGAPSRQPHGEGHGFAPESTSGLDAMDLLQVSNTNSAFSKKVRSRAHIVAREVGMDHMVVAAVIQTTMDDKQIASTLGLPLHRVTQIRRAYREVVRKTARSTFVTPSRRKRTRRKRGNRGAAPASGGKSNPQGSSQTGKVEPKTKKSGSQASTQKQKPPARPRKRKTNLHKVNAVPRCRACGVPIGPNGRCGCS